MNARRSAIGEAVVALLVVVGVAVPGGAQAQGRDAPRLVTDFGLSYILSDPPANETRRALVTWELGYGVLDAESGSLAIVTYAATNDDQFRWGVRGRWTFDAPMRPFVAPGVIIAQSDTNLRIEQRFGPSVQAGLSAGRFLTITAEGESTAGGETLRLGASASSWLGAITGVLVPAIGLALAREG